MTRKERGRSASERPSGLKRQIQRVDELLAGFAANRKEQRTTLECVTVNNLKQLRAELASKIGKQR